MTVSPRVPPHSGTAKAERAALRMLCLTTDPYSFGKHVLGYKDFTPDCHGVVADFFMTTPYPRNLYLWPRDHFKTTLLTVSANVQRVLRNPEVQILIGSNKQENASSMLNEIKGHLESPRLVALFPEILWPDPGRQAGEAWSNSSIAVKRKRRRQVMTIETIGVEGELTSKHYDHRTFDDIVGKENSQTREQLEHAKEFWRHAQQLSKPHTTEDLIGTTWHHADVWAYLQERQARYGMRLGVYKRACWEPCAPGSPRGAEVAGHGWVTPVFPERFTIQKLLEIRADIGDAIFNAQYLLNPLDESTAVFKRSLLNVRPRAELPPNEHLWLVMTVDPAISEQKWADYSAIAVTGFDRTGMMHIVDLRRGRWPESRLIEEVYDAWAATPGIRAIGFEAIGFAKAYRRLFTAEGERRGAYLPVVTLERDTKKAKSTRIQALEPYWSRGHLFIADHVPALADFLDEADRFRIGKESVHDDLLDAVADAIQLRLRPAEAPAQERLIDDPEGVERLEWAWRAQEQRRASGQPPLDDLSLKIQWSRHVYERERQREQVNMTLGNAQHNEFWSAA